MTITEPVETATVDAPSTAPSTGVNEVFLITGMLVGSIVLALAMVAVSGIGTISTGIPSVIGLGTVFGSINALMVVGIVLSYRSAHVINFAQASFGAVAVTLFLLLSEGVNWPFLLAAPLSVAFAAFLGVVTELIVIRRFSRASRLVVTVALIAIALGFSGFASMLPLLPGFRFGSDDNPLPSSAAHSPFDGWTFEWFPVIFNGNHVFAVVATAGLLVGLAAFFRFSDVGVAVRGAAENAARAELLGIKVNNLSTIVWGVVGVLSGVAALTLTLTTQGSLVSVQGSVAVGTGSLLRLLAAAVIAKMDRIPRAVAAALAISFIQQGAVWWRGDTRLFEVALLLIVVSALLLLRSRGGRVDDVASTWEATEEIRPIPAELADLPEVKNFVRRALWGLGIVVAAWPWVMDTEQTNLGGVYAIYGIIGISLVVLTGWGGQISLGQFGFAGIGAAVAGWVTSSAGLPFLAGVVAGSLAAAAVAVLIGIPALRIQGLFLAVTTLGFSVVVANWLLPMTWVPRSVGRPEFLFVNANADERSMYYISVIGLGIALFCAAGLRRSRTGRVLIAMRDNERAAQSFGLNLLVVRLRAFAISGLLAGFAGSLFAFSQRTVEVQSFTPNRSIQMFLMAVLGGVGSIYTVLVGAVFVATVTLMVDNVGLELIINSVGLLAILSFFPRGLGALFFQLRDIYLRRVAYRRRIFSPTLMGDRIKEGEEARVDIEPRLSAQGPVEKRYRLDSDIGKSGASQLDKLWRV